MGVWGIAFLDGLGEVFDLEGREDIPGLRELRTVPEDLILRLRARDGNPEVILAWDFAGGGRGAETVPMLAQDVCGPGKGEVLPSGWRLLQGEGDGPQDVVDQPTVSILQVEFLEPHEQLGQVDPDDIADDDRGEGRHCPGIFTCDQGFADDLIHPCQVLAGKEIGILDQVGSSLGGQGLLDGSPGSAGGRVEMAGRNIEDKASGRDRAGQSTFSRDLVEESSRFDGQAPGRAYNPDPLDEKDDREVLSRRRAAGPSLGAGASAPRQRILALGRLQGGDSTPADPAFEAIHTY